MNPFTQAILRRLHRRLRQRSLTRWVSNWDRLESLVIRIYKAEAATRADEVEYQRLRAGLLKGYPRWQSALEPHWRQTKINQAPTPEDPFLSLLARRQAADFAADWDAMQTLPAAREALNLFLTSQVLPD